MIRSPTLTGIPAAPIVTPQVELESNVISAPFGSITPFGQAGPLIGLASIASVLSMYITVITSLAGPEVPSGLVIVGPRLLPGSIGGRITLHPGLVELGPWKVKLKEAGGRLTGFPVLHPLELAVLGIEMPPVGIPVPVWMRSCTIKLSPERMLSLMSDF